MKKERWWQYVDEDGTNNLRGMLMYLIDVLRDKEQISYESACNYVVEIFRYCFFSLRSSFYRDLFS